MNKKGDFNFGWSFMYVLVICFLIMMVVAVIDTVVYENRIDEACEMIGAKHKIIQETDACLQTDGEAFFVDFECKGLLWAKKCTAQRINIGDFNVRIK